MLDDGYRKANGVTDGDNVVVGANHIAMVDGSINESGGKLSIAFIDSWTTSKLPPHEQ